MKNETTNQPKENALFFMDQESKMRALQNGLNLKKLGAFINSICATFTDKEKPNSIHTNSDFVWLYVHNPKTGFYEDMQSKYHNCKGWELPQTLKEKNKKKLLTNLIKCAANSADFKKTNKPRNNYFVKELANNKPLTLINAKDKNFVCFVVFGQYGKINEIDITDYKQEFTKTFFDISNNCWNAETIRKQAENIYAVYNKGMTQYNKLCGIIAEKRNNRSKYQSEIKKEEKRYFYTDDSFLNDLLNSVNNLHLYNSFSHNSLLKKEFDICAPGLEIKYNEITFLKTTEPMTRQQVFNYCVDHSGFCVLFYREKLLRRLKTLKAERARAKEEQERKEWETSDKTELLNELDKYINYLAAAIIERSSNLQKILKNNTFQELKKYRELYLRFERQKEFKNYSSVSEWRKKLEEKIKDFNFYDRAIKNNVLDRVACVHHYEKQQDGSYKNISKDSFFADPGRYVQEF